MSKGLYLDTRNGKYVSVHAADAPHVRPDGSKIPGGYWGQEVGGVLVYSGPFEELGTALKPVDLDGMAKAMSAANDNVARADVKLADANAALAEASKRYNELASRADGLKLQLDAANAKVADLESKLAAATAPPQTNAK